ncbi:MAG: hypothetical protein ACO3YO_08415 [Chthoniobacterales bacterium]
MNWKLKSALRRALLALPQGAALYRCFTSRVLGTQHGMAAKWFRVFPAHVRVLKEKFGSEARNVPLWCFDSGTTPAAGFAAAIVSDAEGLLSDRWNRLTDRYLGTSRGILSAQGAELAKIADAPRGRFEQVCSAVAPARSSRQALAAVHMTYASSHDAAGSVPWRGRIGLVYSAGTFEHYTPAEVESALAVTSQALRPGGVLSHVVDHRDHRWHADKGISPLLHLALDDDVYLKKFGNPLDYHNRWMKSRWVECLERHGFEVEARTVIGMTGDLVPLPREKFASGFRSLSDEDIASLVTHFVAVKRD